MPLSFFLRGGIIAILLGINIQVFPTTLTTNGVNHLWTVSPGLDLLTIFSLKISIAMSNLINKLIRMHNGH